MKVRELLLLNDCPICGQKLLSTTTIVFKYCKNDCFTVLDTFDTVIVKIFDKQHKFHIGSILDEFFLREIEYWKENDRYVLKILSEQGD